MSTPAIFVDRDGTLIEEVNYLSRVEDLKLFPYTATSVQKFKNLGYLVIVITNQSGIGRGIYTESDMHAIHAEIQNKLSGAVDGFYFCPHLPDEGCKCRKPGRGMIDDACRDHRIDLAASWMIGDKKLDVMAGVNAGLSTAMVLTGYGTEHSKSLEVSPTLICSDLWQAAGEIEKLTSAEIVL